MMIASIARFADRLFKSIPPTSGVVLSAPNVTDPFGSIPIEINRESKLTCTWFYKKLKLVLGHQIVGPISGEEFLALHEADKFYDDTSVQSPEFTNGQWVDFQRVNLPVVRNRVDQRSAEIKRKQAAQDRIEQISIENRRRLQRAVSEAISDGKITGSELSQLTQFAAKTGIPIAEVEELLQKHGQQLISAAIEDAIEDGILDPQERQRIGELATGLGLQVEPSEDQNRRLHLCELAYQLASAAFVPNCKTVRGLQLNANETCLEIAPFDWYEIVQSRKATGIALGGDHYLKTVAAGRCLLTNKRVLLIGDLAAKKFTLSSVAKATRYSDGVLFTRSTGKSVFLRADEITADCERWGMLAIYTVTGEPTLGSRPSQSFVPKNATPLFETPEFQGSNQNEPKYTFRVVGDHIDDRSYWIGVLQPGGPLNIEREPQNKFDANAVAVFNSNGKQLGYLKREVAQWFAPILDRGRRFRYTTFRKPSQGGLIVGVYDQ